MNKGQSLMNIEISLERDSDNSDPGKMKLAELVDCNGPCEQIRFIFEEPHREIDLPLSTLIKALKILGE